MPKGATTTTSKAAVGFEYCNKLFALEKKFSKMSDDVRKTARQVKAEPLLEAYWLWLKTLDPTPGSKLAEAVAYALNQKPYLSAFLDHMQPHKVFAVELLWHVSGKNIAEKQSKL